MSRRLLVNDCLSALPDHRTFWHDLQDWTGAEFIGGDFRTLAGLADAVAESGEERPSLIIRNGSYFGPLKASATVPTISLVQDIFEEGPAREMQIAVGHGSRRVVFNSEFTRSKCASEEVIASGNLPVIPLPVDFKVFQIGNPMGLQQFLSLPDKCVLWVGACREAGIVKGFDIFLGIVRANPDIPFVGVFKDEPPDSFPPNLRVFSRVSHEELAQIIGACRIGLCTSRTETQHLAGIEMGACGLPVIAPPVGIYWNRAHIGLTIVNELTVAAFSAAIRSADLGGSRTIVRELWKRDFDVPVVRDAWMKLIEEVKAECSGRS